MHIYLNGKIVPEKEAVVSVFDHGLLYGDGVFEGIRTYHGKVFRLEDHIDRLYRSAAVIALSIPISKEEMAKAVVETCKANDCMNGYIRLIITRWVGGLGLNPYLCKEPQVIIIAGAIQLYPKELYEKGMAVVTVGTVRNQVEAINPRIKSLNYLNNVMAKIEAINAGVMECIMMNPQGFVAEASGDNIFVIRGKQLLTPPVWCGALEGITRQVVMELAPSCGLTVKEDVLTRYDLFTADEMFLTGTAAEIISVTNVDRRTIGSGVPGPYTQALLAAFGEETRKTGTPVA